MAITVDEFAKKLPYELIPTNIEGAFTRRHSPLSGFDPNNASTSELKEHGIFVPRPSETDSPVLRAAWQRAFSKHWRPEDFIMPELECERGITHHRKKFVNMNGINYSGNWSGATLKGRWAAAFGTWIVPTVSKPSNGTGSGWDSSSWVGIDGAYTSTDVLQAGVEQKVDASGNASYLAWYEWYAPDQKDAPAPDYVYQTNFKNFPVKAGDRVSCYVEYINSVAGGVTFANETSGQHTRVTLVPPPGATFNGESAEWIMETPNVGGVTASLPKFSSVQFTSAFAFSNDGRTIGNPKNGDISIIGNASVNPPEKLTAAVLGDESVTISLDPQQ